jgi:hypothetical protein
VLKSSGGRPRFIDPTPPDLRAALFCNAQLHAVPDEHWRACATAALALMQRLAAAPSNGPARRTLRDFTVQVRVLPDALAVDFAPDRRVAGKAVRFVLRPPYTTVTAVE